ncbi:histidine phosphatase superfamily [Aspergillus bertholletiae]|uniref:Phytase A n=1 Tax=Aspergillus bertholletiae TaxID=1226010 RepID=A0A5N7BMQ3_9EURO|nr:histidine phosphatase superfamily [Aspergillus bertholletiae]
MKGLYEDRPIRGEGLARRFSNSKRVAIVSIMAVLSVLLPLTLFLSSVVGTPVTSPKHQSCNTVDEGYQCFSGVSHLWGQYSPYFSVDDESSLSDDIPDHCQVTFAQVLSRHGARYPTESKSKKYAKLIKAIQHNATSFTGKYAFLKSYNYTLGADDLTAFGESQMVNSGIKFYQRYEKLAKDIVPFIRASGSDRVIASGEKFIEGFQKAKLGESKTKQDQPAPIVNVIIPETDGFNNTLDHGTCTVFESSEAEDEAEEKFINVFTPSIIERLEKNLPGIKISGKELVYLMDMCSYDTIALTRDGSRISPFCALFTHEEWVQYDYLQSVGKYYGYGAGNSLGPAQGIGFANELIARLTQSPVKDHTSTNTTLDSNPATFPLNAKLYADFSHDNAMTSIYFALGLYNQTKLLSQTSVQSTEETNGYSAAWTVPFAARAYFEMMQCKGEKEPLVRVLVNDRVIPLQGCDADKHGRCKRDDFIEGLSFVTSDGNWAECFA